MVYTVSIAGNASHQLPFQKKSCGLLNSSAKPTQNTVTGQLQMAAHIQPIHHRSRLPADLRMPLRVGNQRNIAPIQKLL